MRFKIPLQIHKNVYILTLFNMKIANTYKKFSFACQVLLSFSTFLYISYRIYQHQFISYVQFWGPMDYSLPGSSVHGILWARILEWVAIPSLGDFSDLEIEHRSAALQADSLPSELPVTINIQLFHYHIYLHCIHYSELFYMLILCFLLFVSTCF